MSAWQPWRKQHNINKEDSIYLEQSSVEGMADWRKRHVFLFKTICYVLIFAFILYDITWAQGGAPLSFSPKVNPVKINGKTYPEGVDIPYEAGWAHEEHFNGGNEAIFNIQDPHAHLSAQESIVKILENLSSNYDLNLIAVEGAEGPVDISFLKTFPDYEIKKNAAEYLMREGKMSAGEFFAIVSEKPIKLYGAEEGSLYTENVDLLRRFMESKLDSVSNAGHVLKALRRLEPLIYSPDLKELLDKSDLHEDSKISFVSYWETIKTISKKNDIDILIFESLSKLLQSIDLEKKISKKDLNKERKLLLDTLVKDLSKEELEDLVKISLSFKAKKISQSKFHKYIMHLAQSKNTSLRDYPNLVYFAQYIAIYEDIDFMKLFREVKDIESYLREQLFKTDEERTLYNFTKAIKTIKKLFEISINNDDHNFILTKRNYFNPAELQDFIDKSFIKYNLSNGSEYSVEAIFSKMDEAIELYNIAQRRNNAMVSNTIKAMRQNKEHVAALITGGFHSKGLAELIKKEDLSYLIIMPKYKEGEKRPYIAILTKKNKPYKELIKSGEYMLAVHAFFWENDDTQIRDVIMEIAADIFDKYGNDIEAVKKAFIEHFKEFQPVFQEMKAEREKWGRPEQSKTPIKELSDFQKLYEIELASLHLFAIHNPDIASINPQTSNITFKPIDTRDMSRQRIEDIFTRLNASLPSYKMNLLKASLYNMMAEARASQRVRKTGKDTYVKNLRGKYTQIAVAHSLDELKAIAEMHNQRMKTAEKVDGKSPVELKIVYAAKAEDRDLLNVPKSKILGITNTDNILTEDNLIMTDEQNLDKELNRLYKEALQKHKNPKQIGIVAESIEGSIAGKLHKDTVVVECPQGINEATYDIALKLLAERPIDPIPYVTRQENKGQFWYTVGKLPEADTLELHEERRWYHKVMKSALKDF